MNSILINLSKEIIHIGIDSLEKILQLLVDSAKKESENIFKTLKEKVDKKIDKVSEK